MRPKPIYPPEEALRYSTRDFSSWRPRPRDIPTWRRTLLSAWRPGGSFWRLADVLREFEGGQDFTPEWETLTLGRAELWFVGSDMCDLLAAVAPSMPDAPLHVGELPDQGAGLVLFASALTGIDAEASGVPVTVGGYLWGPASWRGNPTLGITVYGPNIFPETPLSPPYLHPLGGLVWPFGQPADVQLADHPVVDASMAEDRRRLRALWTISAQPDLSRSVRHVPEVRNRKKARRIASGTAERPEAVRVVYLRHQPPRPPTEHTGRTHHHRWVTSGHWRNQAYGPKWSLHRPIYINPYLSGPENAPLLTGEKVRAWIR